MDDQQDRFQDVLDLIRTLRGDGGCPWDRKQTIDTLTTYAKEEFQELVEALDAEASEKIREEMGDVIFLLLFMAEVAREKGQFSIGDVLEQVKEKMIGRHPHVFGNVRVKGVEDVKDNWKKIKEQEKLRASRQTLAEKMPRNLPALQQAMWVLQNTHPCGTAAEAPVAALEKLQEKAADLRAVVTSGDQRAARSVVGDLLFSLVGVSLGMDIRPQNALKEAIQRFLENAEQKGAARG